MRSLTSRLLVVRSEPRGHGRRVLVTDGAANMLRAVERKAQAAGLAERVQTQRVLLEELEQFAEEGEQFAGAFSNFAALNCVADLTPCARGLARLLPQGAHALLVVFGAFCPGEIIVQMLRGDARAAFRVVLVCLEHPFAMALERRTVRRQNQIHFQCRDFIERREKLAQGVVTRFISGGFLEKTFIANGFGFYSVTGLYRF